MLRAQAIPGVVIGIPFLAFNRLKDLEGDAYTETVFTDKQPPRRPGAEPVVRKRDIDMTYAELEAKYGEATLFKDDLPPSATPANEPFALPELPNPFGGGAAPPPKGFGSSGKAKGASAGAADGGGSSLKSVASPYFCSSSA